jgi:hypothetical protein
LSVRRIAALIMLAGLMVVPACGVVGDGETIDDIVAPYRFSVVDWERRMLPAEIIGWLDDASPLDDDDTDLVVACFTLGARLRALNSQLDYALASGNLSVTALTTARDEIAVERGILVEDVRDIIARQITVTLEQHGIVHPFENIEPETVFPPVSFVLESPPTLLVVSPRERIFQERTVTLAANLKAAQRAAIEGRVDALGDVSLVVNLGGIGAAYPAFVNDDYRLHTTIEVAVEEWLHQYLAFEPLGRAYIVHLLGIRQDGDIVTMNETLVGIASEEIALRVMEAYYPAYIIADDEPAGESEFDYNREMRETRLAVDTLLEQGDIEQAEAYMEERRQYLAANGYYIRKLNQAYFAFHGSYADELTSVDPIGAELRVLREQYDSLREYLEVVAAMQSRDELTAALAR